MKLDSQYVYLTLQNFDTRSNIFILFFKKFFPLVIPLVVLTLFTREILELPLDANRLALKDHTGVIPYFSSNTLHYFCLI